ncbi:MAG: UDP-N-acetylmuramate--L-alanine ligase [Planctomycetota bacterium]
MGSRLRRIATTLPPPAVDLSADRPQSVYLIGIGGCGMSGVARMLRARGHAVEGSDQTESPVTRALAAEGFRVGFDQQTPWIPEGCELVIASAAVRPDHPQILEAQRRGVPAIFYAEALGALMAPAMGVAVAGTHGKSTTTAMLGHTLAACGLDPSVIVGANAPSFGGTGFRVGSEQIPAGPLAGGPGVMVAEACEYNRSFLNLRPRVASISSVEADHLDVYGSIDQVVEAFHEFATLLPADSADPRAAGRLLIAHDAAHRREVTKGLACRVETIGLNPEADWHVAIDPRSAEVTLREHGRVRANFRSPMPGVHSALNASTAVVLALWLGADPADATGAIARFPGLDRRLQRLPDRAVAGGSVRVYDDYGHHPTEIDLTLRAIRAHERPEARGGRLVCVFQPHQHSRTRFLLDEFATAFERADMVIVPHIYFVRDSEAEKQRVSAADLVDRLLDRGVRAMHLYPFEAIVDHLRHTCREGDVVVVMGAGPVWQVAHAFAGEVEADLPEPKAATA